MCGINGTHGGRGVVGKGGSVAKEKKGLKKRLKPHANADAPQDTRRIKHNSNNYPITHVQPWSSSSSWSSAPAALPGSDYVCVYVYVSGCAV